MRVAAYIRVSTDEQADKGNSLGEQEERLISYCRAMGWERPILYIDDGYSAKDLNRPEMIRLLDDIDQNKYDMVLTTKIDRLSRKLLDLLNLIKQFEQHNCGYASASEQLDTATPVGKMVLQILGAFAEFERERISERVRDNMISIAKHSKQKLITRPCYGYDAGDGIMEINEDEAEVVKQMVSWVFEGHGLREISKRLNQQGIRTKGNKNSRDFSWEESKVRRLLANETICGMMIYNKRKSSGDKIVIRDKNEWVIQYDHHPAIISRNEFNELQTILHTRKLANRHVGDDTYLLSGLVRCKHCGEKLSGNTQKMKRGSKEYEYNRYICQTYVKKGGCFYHAIYRDDIERLIVDRITEVAQSAPGDMNLKVSNPRNIQKEQNDLQNALKKIDHKMQKQIEAYEDDAISKEDLRRASTRIEGERSKIMKQLADLEKNQDKLIQAKVHQKAKDLIGDILSDDRLKVKEAIRLLVSNIEVSNGEIVDITWFGG
ncbi:recombinase family protein [Paenibacillus albiflavus]|uniref:Recombinase family protein n=1 Tax=Paenibacillus albiflavus TaxID=2545760 RepID=A0A4R4E8M3_9BACL|nr:recombinase family protein [Paenibacillus albiflavus]TCZ76146.1 recombinase family protein [Paenibacillus albiflavus]